MRVSYHADYQVELPAAHPFPMSKYPLLHARLLAAGVVRASDVMTPDEAPREWLARVHTPAYLAKLESGALTAQEVRRLGVPWSARLWRRSRLAVHGTYLAARAALEDGVAGNLAGGTHHAFPDHGEGFCVLNDVAIAVRQLQHEQALARALVVDLDVHQGNGTAAIFEQDPSVYTLSLHGAKNYPVHKTRSSLDVGLEDGIGDDGYLDALDAALARAFREFAPDLVFYLAGVDVARGDRYGKLALTDAGVRRRDRCVVQAVRSRALPLAIVLGGGYAPTKDRTAELHSYAFIEAAAHAARPAPAGEAGAHATLTP